MQYIYRRYGRERAGIAATVIHYRSRSTVREVGKALGLSEDVTARLASTIWGSFENDMEDDRYGEAGLDARQSRDRAAEGAGRPAAAHSRAICRSMSAASC